MPVTQIGLVYYADDQHKNVFRKVLPVHDDSELDDPRWITENLDKTRTAVLIKVPADSAQAHAPMTGTP